MKLLIGRDDWRIASELPGRVAMAIYGFILGLAASLIGVSGGSISAMILTLYGTAIHKVVGTAAALGVPVVALFGPNVPRRAAPANGRLAFAEVELPCRPCNQVLADCVLPEYNCMDRISVEAVLAQVAAVLGRS